VLALLQHLGFVDLNRDDEMVISGLTDQIVVTREGRQVRFQNLDVGTDELLTRKQGDDVLRVVLVGGSMAKGVPYSACPAGDIRSWMQALLEARYPSLEVQVLNACVGGMNSTGVAATIRRIAPLKPDVVIVLSGNNEGYVPDAVQATLHRWLVYRAMRKALMSEPKDSDRPWHYKQDEDVWAIEGLYRDNIQAVVDSSKRKRYALVLATMPLNLKWSGTQIPGVEDATEGKAYPSLEIDDNVDRGLRFCAEGNHEAALEAFSGSERPYIAGLALGQCLEDMGRPEVALEIYTELVQAHPMGRARPSFNRIVREVAMAPPDVVLAALDQAYLSRDTRGLPDPTLFLDHCHMTAEGYHLVARELVQQMVDQGLVTGGQGEPAAGPSLDALIATRGWNHLITEDCPLGLATRDIPARLRSSQLLSAVPTFDMIQVLPGTIMMGTPVPEERRHADEQEHEVTLTRPFLVGATEVTQALFSAVMDYNPSRHRGPTLPVDSVSWFEAIEFCNRLSELSGLQPAYTVLPGGDIEWDREADGYRLPTESEWEVACRAGTTTAFPTGQRLQPALAHCRFEGDPPGPDMVWVDGEPNEVRALYPNHWGLHDVLGNVREWCWDEYGPYPAGPAVDPVGAGKADHEHAPPPPDGRPGQGPPPDGPPPPGAPPLPDDVQALKQAHPEHLMLPHEERVTRGGSWQTYAGDARCGRRDHTPSTTRHPTLGLRLARTVAEESP